MVCRLHVLHLHICVYKTCKCKFCTCRSSESRLAAVKPSRRRHPCGHHSSTVFWLPRLRSRSVPRRKPARGAILPNLTSSRWTGPSAAISTGRILKLWQRCLCLDGLRSRQRAVSGHTRADPSCRLVIHRSQHKDQILSLASDPQGHDLGLCADNRRFYTAPGIFFDRFSALGVLLNLATIIGVVCLVYSIFGMNRRVVVRLTVEVVKALQRATEVVLNPVGDMIDFKPGQFACVEVQGKGCSEPHPFTISSAPCEGRFRLTMKPDPQGVRGPATGPRGGPYGRFDAANGLEVLPRRCVVERALARGGAADCQRTGENPSSAPRRG